MFRMARASKWMHQVYQILKQVRLTILRTSACYKKWAFQVTSKMAPMKCEAMMIIMDLTCHNCGRLQFRRTSWYRRTPRMKLSSKISHLKSQTASTAMTTISSIEVSTLTRNELQRTIREIKREINCQAIQVTNQTLKMWFKILSSSLSMMCRLKMWKSCLIMRIRCGFLQIVRKTKKEIWMCKSTCQWAQVLCRQPKSIRMAVSKIAKKRFAQMWYHPMLTTRARRKSKSSTRRNAKNYFVIRWLVSKAWTSSKISCRILTAKNYLWNAPTQI